MWGRLYEILTKVYLVKESLNAALRDRELCKYFHEARFSNNNNDKHFNKLHHSFFHRCTVHLDNVKIHFNQLNALFIEHLKC
jgi:hypothetical protein